jgi:acetyl-CoA carboxylase biotin carboxyl carrier protein
MTNTLKDYVDAFRVLGLSELSVEDDGVKLVLKKNSSYEPEIFSSNISEISEKGKEPSKEDIKSGTRVKAPLLGVFYAEVNGKVWKTGDRVQKGDILCSIEAMKMMNEVKAPCDGEIISINVKDGDLVEYDQVLFEIS